MATINKHKEALYSENLVDEIGPNTISTTVEKSAKNHSGSAKSDTGFDASVFSWMFDKLLSYYVLMVVGLVLLKYFEIISLNGFLVGLFSAFGISLALLGHGFSKLARHAKQTHFTRPPDSNFSD